MLAVVDRAAAIVRVDRETFLARGRDREVVRARQAAAWVLQARWEHLSLSMLGKVMGNRDNSTMLFSLRQARAFRERDEWFLRLTDALLAFARSQADGPGREEEAILLLEAENAAREALHLEDEPLQAPRPAERGDVQQESDELVGYDFEDMLVRGSAALLAAIGAAYPERMVA
ncbi:hypothetical protein AAW00_13495 [Aurantiacibacter luteus]|uniref:Chromosomal replication initiator DnaA C-terminal domain-containing protein n=2 Tax=Aurantiacibacter luteus TaxID=1581420 RepID=A0A0G9MNZ6_9SPHN|nr:hypothetical protein AAW00_13495 [Aurantiacibacter luteus]